MPKIAKTINSLFTNWEAGTTGIKEVCYLTREENWNSYKINGISDCWAIGAPSLEMFVASYNATHSTQISCQVPNSTSQGYAISASNLGNTADLDKAIYCSSSQSYILSSSSSGNPISMMWVNKNGSVSSSQGSIGIRPIVSIPLSYIGTGVGKIQITNNYFSQ